MGGNIDKHLCCCVDIDIPRSQVAQCSLGRPQSTSLVADSTSSRSWGNRAAQLNSLLLPIANDRRIAMPGLENLLWISLGQLVQLLLQRIGTAWRESWQNCSSPQIIMFELACLRRRTVDLVYDGALHSSFWDVTENVSIRLRTMCH